MSTSWGQIRSSEDVGEVLARLFIRKTTSPANYHRTERQVGCSSPCLECISLEYAQDASYLRDRIKYRCVRMLTDPPEGMAHQLVETAEQSFYICDSAVLHWKPSLPPSKSKPDHKAPASPPEGRGLEVKTYLEEELRKASRMQTKPGIARAAKDVIYNTDYCSNEDWVDLCDYLLKRIHEDRPWKKVKKV